MNDRFRRVAGQEAARPLDERRVRVAKSAALRDGGGHGGEGAASQGSEEPCGPEFAYLQELDWFRERFAARGLLGRGGHGLVVRVHDAEFGFDVALKTVGAARHADIESLKTEFRILAGISHPGLVQRYQLFVDRGRSFFTMELLERPVDLVGFIRGAAGAGEALTGNGRERLGSALRQLVPGIETLHRAGILHRDIKPSNLLVTGTGRVVVSDFGLAERTVVVGPRSVQTFSGTSAYLAPECLWGQPATVAADGYALGAVLFEALTGVALRERPEMAVRSLTVSVDPRELVPEIEPRIAELIAGLLTPSPAQRPTIRALLDYIDATKHPTNPSVRRLPRRFIGRRAALDWLSGVAERADTAGLAIAVVTGEAGVGKTALVQHFLEGRSQWVTLAADCRPQESIPLNAWDEPLAGLRRLVEASDLPLDLEPEARAAIERVFPSFAVGGRSTGDDTVQSATMPMAFEDPRVVRRQAIAALARILADLSGRGAILWIDNAQWADADSVEVLLELLRLRRGRFFVVLGARGAVQEMPASLRTVSEFDASIAYLHLEPLTSEDCRALAEEALQDAGTGSEVEWLVARSSGSPFLLLELAAAASEGKRPADESEILVSRIRASGRKALALAEVVALAGQAMGFREVVEAADGRGAESSLYRLQESLFLRPGNVNPRGFEVYHDRVRDLVIARMSDERRRYLHVRVAEVLASRAQAPSTVIFDHLMAAGRRVDAATWGERAGDEALRGFAFTRAAELYESVFEMKGRRQQEWPLLERWANALSMADRGSEAGRLLTEAAEAATAVAAQRGDILRLYASAARERLRAGDVDAGLLALADVASRASLVLPGTPTAALAHLLLRRIHLWWRGLDYVERPVAAQQTEKLEQIDAAWAGTIGLNSFDAIRSATFQAQHTRMALSAGEPHRVARALTAEAVYRAAEGGHRGRTLAAAQLRRVESLADRLKDSRTTAFAHLCGGIAHYFSGDWQEALSRLQVCESLLRALHGTAWERSMCAMYQLWALTWVGDLAELRRKHDIDLETVAATKDWLSEIGVSSGHANLRWLLEGDSLEGRRRAGRAIARFPGGGFQSPHYADLVAQTRIDLYEGQPFQAWDRIAGAWPRLRRSQLLRLQLFRVELLYLRACVASAAHRRLEGNGERRGRATWLATIHWSEALLRREKYGVADVFARTLRASLATAPRDQEALIGEAIALAQHHSMGLHVRSLQTVLGNVSASGSDRSLPEVSDRIARALLPTFRQISVDP